MSIASELRASPEVRVLRDPVAVYRDLAGDDAGGRWCSRAWLLALMLGSLVSFMASGRLTLRLLVDGAISLGFIPVLEIVALAVVRRGTDAAAGSFRGVLDRCLVGNAPWLWWLGVVMAVGAAVPPRRMHLWFWPLLATAVIPAGWSAVLDFHFFRQVLGRDARGAVRGVVLIRAIAWTLGIVYFFGIALWGDLGI